MIYIRKNLTKTASVVHSEKYFTLNLFHWKSCHLERETVFFHRSYTHLFWAAVQSFINLISSNAFWYHSKWCVCARCSCLRRSKVKTEESQRRAGRLKTREAGQEQCDAWNPAVPVCLCVKALENWDSASSYFLVDVTTFQWNAFMSVCVTIATWRPELRLVAGPQSQSSLVRPV